MNLLSRDPKFYKHVAFFPQQDMYMQRFYIWDKSK